MKEHSVILTAQEFGLAQRVSDETLVAARFDIENAISIRLRRDISSRFNTFTATARFYGIKNEYKWPSDWREAFKERWFPVWARERWPIRYERLNIFEAFPSKQVRKIGGAPVVYCGSVPSPDFSGGEDK